MVNLIVGDVWRRMSSPVKDVVKDHVLGQRLTHPSFGKIEIVRGTCSQSQNLFGSSIKQHAYISIAIHKAVLYRGLNSDTIFSEGAPIVEVQMSPSQFADAITSLNSGGTPCTIEYMNGQKIPEPLLESKRVKFEFIPLMVKISQVIKSTADTLSVEES